MLLSFLLSGCSVGYVWQAAQGQWRLMRSRRPIETVLADPGSSNQLKARLNLVEDARAFATAELGLPENGSYRSYSDLGRPFVVWNVVAAPEFSIEPLRWCFPVTGCIAYRGYFHQQAAHAFAAKLARRGNDVMVGGVSAYSTLGRFSDPVLNTMLRYGDLDMVATIFHELAHQLIYVAGDSDFDEAFAMTVEQEGLTRWLAARGRTAELSGYLQRRAQLEHIVNEFTAGRGRLEALYSQTLPPDVMRARKRALLDEIGRGVLALEAQYGLGTVYDDWIGAGLNNAHLASVATYFACMPAFQRLLEQHGGDLPSFYAAVRELGRARAAERRQFCRAAAPLNTVAGGPGRERSLKK